MNAQSERGRCQMFSSDIHMTTENILGHIYIYKIHNFVHAYIHTQIHTHACMHACIQCIHTCMSSISCYYSKLISDMSYIIKTSSWLIDLQCIMILEGNLNIEGMTYTISELLTEIEECYKTLNYRPPKRWSEPLYFINLCSYKVHTKYSLLNCELSRNEFTAYSFLNRTINLSDSVQHFVLQHCIQVFCWGAAVPVPAANRRRTETISRPCAMFWIRLCAYDSRQAIFFSLCEACRYYCSLFACRVNLLYQKISLTHSFVPAQAVESQYFVLHHLVSLMKSRSVKWFLLLSQFSVCKQISTEPVGVFPPSQQIQTHWVFTWWLGFQGSW